MESLDATVQTFRRAGVVRNVDASQSGLAEFGGGSARGKELDVVGGQECAELDDAGFVGDGD